MAEFMYGKALLVQDIQGNTGASEALAKVILSIGNGLLAQNAFAAAVKWLRRALEVLDGISPMCLTETCTELRYIVLHSLVTGCLQTKTEAELEYARNALETMSEVIVPWFMPMPKGQAHSLMALRIGRREYRYSG